MEKWFCSVHRPDKLPGKLAYVKCKDYKEVADVIRKLVVRGAPAIGVSVTFGLALAAQQSNAKTVPELMIDLDSAFKTLRTT